MLYAEQLKATFEPRSVSTCAAQSAGTPVTTVLQIVPHWCVKD